MVQATYNIKTLICVFEFIAKLTHVCKAVIQVIAQRTFFFFLKFLSFLRIVCGASGVAAELSGLSVGDCYKAIFMPEEHCYDDVLSYLEICWQCVSTMASSGGIMSIQQKLVLKCYVRQVAFDAIKHALVASLQWISPCGRRISHGGCIQRLVRRLLSS